MTLDALIILVGGFVATLPFLGLPNSWDTALFLAAGVLMIALGIVVRRRDRSVAPREARADSFEHSPSSQTDMHALS